MKVAIRPGLRRARCRLWSCVPRSATDGCAPRSCSQGHALRLRPAAPGGAGRDGQAGMACSCIWRARGPRHRPDQTSCAPISSTTAVSTRTTSTSTLACEPDERSYPAPAVTLRHPRFDRVRLLTNNPAKVEALAREGISSIGRINLPPVPVPVMVYAVLPGKFPVRICRELKLRHPDSGRLREPG
jgi:GTP cyclohydrolase II